jgi:hypothetical protein
VEYAASVSGVEEFALEFGDMRLLSNHELNAVILQTINFESQLSQAT